MELDEMKLVWQVFDWWLVQQQVLYLQLYCDSWMDYLWCCFCLLVWGLLLQILFGIVLMLWGISFWFSYLGDVGFMISGIVMQVFGMLGVIFLVWMLVMLQGIDYVVLVLDIQYCIVDLCVWCVKVEVLVFVVLGSVIWIFVLLMFV